MSRSSIFHLNRVALQMWPEKCHSMCGTIKIPPCSKALSACSKGLSAEHRPWFCSPSPGMVTSPYKWKIDSRTERAGCFKTFIHDGILSIDDDWLIYYLRFYVPLKNISLIWSRHHYRRRAAKFWPMLGAQGVWAGRNLYRATPAVKRDLSFSGLIRRTAPFSRLLRHTRGCGGFILILTSPTEDDKSSLFKTCWKND
jgi:hypothetical protein